MRYSMLELTQEQEAALLKQLNKPIPQPDPFGGQGDFVYGPQAFEGMQERAVRAAAREANLIALFDRPFSKMTKKDLIGMIRIAQDILVQPVGRM
jgi:hypothetical protein